MNILHYIYLCENTMSDNTVGLEPFPELRVDLLKPVPWESFIEIQELPSTDEG